MILPMVLPVYRWYGTNSKLPTLRETLASPLNSAARKLAPEFPAKYAKILSLFLNLSHTQHIQGAQYARARGLNHRGWGPRTVY